ncbi:phospholipase effector Tle1 domain-containing protein [Eoetvoesiella caeni]|uniref:RHS repeat-associated protein n=1 Tax=Eoetvoesiella caeni TaxID=645616 RepID=A0A366HIN2_9BURK|nr:DUF2235 domain-containing protein [Eoetvoesiella caeni]MCI2808207.1 DUF2235 domain-containing protein [Eoetvoesiella caeni]NYT53790.1 DUF2235 domain-containing protein [Eoetvoesiella caeni]RBP42132.1 RHS repeat-associated protein [Eoetvoesiella caeni]
MTRIFLGLVAALTFSCTSVADLVCQPSTLGSPCGVGGIATQAAPEPGLNLGAGNPVHLATGNKYQLEHDLPPQPRAPLLEVARHYNALDRRPSPLGQGWALAYDTRVHLVANRWQIVQADGSRIIFSGQQEDVRTNAHGRLQRQESQWLWTWPDGRQLQFNSHGLLVRVARTSSSGPSLNIERHDQAGPMSGSIKQITDNNGRALVFTYSVHQQRAYLRSIDTPAGRFHYQYEPAEQKPAQQESAEPGTAPATPGMLRLQSVTRPDGMQRRYLYEPEHQAGNAFHLTGIEIVSVDRKETQRINTWAYDAQGRAVLSIEGGPASDKNKLRIEYVRTASVRQSGLTIVHGEQGRTTRFRVAQQGGRHVLLGVEGAPCPGCAAPGTQASYDVRGRLIQVNGMLIRRHPQGGIRQLVPAAAGWPGLVLDYSESGLRTSWRSAATGTERAIYGARGQLLRRVFANDDRWDYRHDAAGRLVAVAAGNAQPEARLSWHGQNLLRIEHPNETDTRQYDQDNRLAARTVQRNAAGIPALYTERYGYDGHNRLTVQHLPEGGKLVYRWGAQQRLLGIVWHDVQGKSHTVIQSLPSQPGYEYGNELRLHTTLQHGQARQLALRDQHGRLLWLQRQDYDKQGRVHHETHHTPVAGHTETWRYAYDRASRLIGAERQDATAQAPSRAPGSAAPSQPMSNNGLGVQAAMHWYAWNQDGSLAALLTGGATEKPRMEYDPSGLPTRVGVITPRYNPQRRLSAIERNDMQLAAYKHNVFGHRVRKRTAAGATDYFYTGNKLTAEARHNAHATQAPRITRRYVYAHDVLVGLVDYSGHNGHGRLYAVHADLLGAPRLLTDEHQAVRWFARYSPTGQAEQLAGDMALDIRLPGQIHDAETGWHDNLLRTYLPAWGHYSEPDPLGPTPGSQMRGYAAQQPRKYIDPTGLLLFAFDGTRNNPQTQTNVWKMSQRYLDGPVFYHSGPGNAHYTDWDSVTAYSAARILDTQWAHLLNALGRPPAAPNETIPIDIIGFSRGASLARHFGNLINNHVDQGLFSYQDELRGLVTACVDLRFMGLFDTVAQFGLGGLRNADYDLSIAPAWGWVAHAVALQEHRWYFPLSSVQNAGNNTIEAPFIGAHADIGGGVGHAAPAGTEPAGGDLSDVALNWMLWQARSVALHFGEGDPSQSEITDPIVHDQRPPVIRVQGSDRPVDAADGNRLHRHQNEHPRLGSAQRQATEQLIDRHESWQLGSTNEVGIVDMAGYALWLQTELGWTSLPA